MCTRCKKCFNFLSKTNYYNTYRTPQISLTVDNPVQFLGTGRRKIPLGYCLTLDSYKFSKWFENSIENNDMNTKHCYYIYSDIIYSGFYKEFYEREEVCLKRTYDTEYDIMRYLFNEYGNPWDKDNVLREDFLYIKGSKREQNNNAILEKTTTSKTRVGQDILREECLELYGYKCLISELSLGDVLEACHIKSWPESNNFEKLDVYNTLLLCKHYHSFMDKGYISFLDDGQILISTKLNKQEFGRIFLPTDTKIDISKNSAKYLQWHRENVFQN